MKITSIHKKTCKAFAGCALQGLQSFICLGKLLFPDQTLLLILIPDPSFQQGIHPGKSQQCICQAEIQWIDSNESKHFALSDYN